MSSNSSCIDIIRRVCYLACYIPGIKRDGDLSYSCILPEQNLSDAVRIGPPLPSPEGTYHTSARAVCRPSLTPSGWIRQAAKQETTWDAERVGQAELIVSGTPTLFSDRKINSCRNFVLSLWPNPFYGLHITWTLYIQGGVLGLYITALQNPISSNLSPKRGCSPKGVKSSWYIVCGRGKACCVRFTHVGEPSPPASITHRHRRQNPRKSKRLRAASCELRAQTSLVGDSSGCAVFSSCIRVELSYIYLHRIFT